MRGRPDLTSLMIPLMIYWILYFLLHPSLLHPFVPRLLMILFE